MPLNFVRNLLFPRTASWQQNQSTKTLLVTVLVAVIFAGAVAAIMVYANSNR